MKPLCVYSRRGCHLCEQLIEDLLPLVDGRIRLDIRDIDSCDEWRARFDSRVPVIEYDGETICQYHLDRDAVATVLNKLSA